jgi:hypothetical protein
MSDSSDSLRALAARCRRLASGGSMESVAAALNKMAFDYDRQADRADKAEGRARELLTGRRQG